MKNVLFRVSNYFFPPSVQRWNEWLAWVFSCLVLITAPLGQLTRLPLGSSGAVYLHEVFLIPAVILLAPNLYAYCTQVGSWRQRKLIIAAGAWITVGMLVAFVHTRQITPLLYALRLLGYLVFCIQMRLLFTSSTHKLRTWLVMFGVWYWWLALLQYLFLPDTRFLWLYGWDDHYYRMIGTLFDPGLTGILLIISSYVAWIVGRRYLLGKVVAVTLLLSVILTYSRASYLAAAGSLLYYVYTQSLVRALSNRALLRIGQIVVLTVITACVIYAVIPKPGGEGVNLLRTSTINARIFSATSTLRDLHLRDWIIGRGLFSLESYQPQTTGSDITVSVSTIQQVDRAVFPDNIAILLIAQTGIIGLIAVIYYLYQTIIWAGKVEPVLAAAIIATIIQSQFNNTLLHPYICLYLGLCIVSYLRFTTRSSST